MAGTEDDDRAMYVQRSSLQNRNQTLFPKYRVQEESVVGENGRMENCRRPAEIYLFIVWSTDKIFFSWEGAPWREKTGTRFDFAGLLSPLPIDWALKFTISILCWVRWIAYVYGTGYGAARSMNSEEGIDITVKAEAVERRISIKHCR